MSTIQPGIFALFERFPNHKRAINARYLRGENFQTICSDYEKCAAAAAYWQCTPGEEAARRSKEYRELLAELEEEIRQMLGESD